MTQQTFISVHVTPRSARDEIVGFEQGANQEALKIRITAPPADGKANKAICKLIADAFGVPKSAVSIANGAASRFKRVCIEADEARVNQWLEQFR